jgi:hypothetical protein
MSEHTPRQPSIPEEHGNARPEEVAPKLADQIPGWFTYPESGAAAKTVDAPSTQKAAVQSDEVYFGENPAVLSEPGIVLILSRWRYELTKHATYSQRILYASATIGIGIDFELRTKDGRIQSLRDKNFNVRLLDHHQDKDAMTQAGVIGSFSALNEIDIEVCALLDLDLFDDMRQLYFAGRLEQRPLTFRSKQLAYVAIGDTIRWNHQRFSLAAISSLSISV